MSDTDIFGDSTEHRTIGGGVIVAYCVTVAAVFGLVALGELGGGTALAAFVGGVILIVVADKIIQFTDMGKIFAGGGGAASRIQSGSGADQD